jgi:hypothetical protein
MLWEDKLAEGVGGGGDACTPGLPHPSLFRGGGSTERRRWCSDVVGSNTIGMKLLDVDVPQQPRM